MFEWIFYAWMFSNAYTLLIIYARVYITPIYSMLVLFTCCWGSDSPIQAEVGNLNRDLLQPSGIRYEVWSFSVRYLISIACWKGLISRVKLSIVVPQAIGISLRNRIGDSAGEFLVIFLWGLISLHSVYLNCSLSLVSVSGMGACIPGRAWLVWI